MHAPLTPAWFRQQLATIPLVIRFFLAGLPAFCGAIVLNRFMVGSLQLNPALAYGVVLFLQMSVNFLICHYFVFESAHRVPIAKAYISFMGGNTVIRLLDWVVYSGLVSRWPQWYLGVQIGNILLFSVAKYLFARSIFEHKERQRP